MRACVVVLGDLARSPRMLYHAESLAAQGVDVDVIGYGRSVTHGNVTPGIVWHDLGEPGALPAGSIRYLLAGAVRVISIGGRLLWRLLRLPQPDIILLQTPPALPTFVVALAAARWRSCRVIVDWHNFMHSMLALEKGPEHPLVRAAAAYERMIGRRADAHLCVSQAMAERLAAWRFEDVHVVRDRPAERFRPVVRNMSGERSRPERRLVVVPSSWSADDDFDLLLDALERCEALIAEHDLANLTCPFPPIDVVLTGRGPSRARYQPRFEHRPARRIHARASWLSFEEYAALLGTAALGICVHRSASGVDLPMKICDMFGAGVPVCALDYGPCLSELVRDGENGRLFMNADELARQMFELLMNATALERLRRGAQASAIVRWREGWLAEAWPVLREGIG